MSDADATTALRRSLGFPEDVVLRSTAVSLPGQCLVVVASSKNAPQRSDRLFLRELGAAGYVEVPWPDDCNSFDAPVISHSAPELFLLGQRWEEVKTFGGGERPLRGCSPVGLYRVELPSGRIELVQSGDPPGSTGANPSGPRRYTLSELVGFSPDGRLLLVKYGVGERDAGVNSFAARFERRIVGGRQHEELWVPAEDLDEFNAHLDGAIRVVSSFFRDDFIGLVPDSGPLAGLTASDQLSRLEAVSLEEPNELRALAIEHRALIFLHLPYWRALGPTRHNPVSTRETLTALEGSWTNAFPQLPLPRGRAVIVPAEAG